MEINHIIYLSEVVVLFLACIIGIIIIKVKQKTGIIKLLRNKFSSFYSYICSKFCTRKTPNGY